MKANFVLTTFSPAMFGEKASIYLKVIGEDEAQALIHKHTQIIATRITHERLARGLFPNAGQTARYANLTPGTVSIHIHYRGPMIPDSGEIPFGGMVTYFLIEVEEYQEAR